MNEEQKNIPYLILDAGFSTESVNSVLNFLNGQSADAQMAYLVLTHGARYDGQTVSEIVASKTTWPIVELSNDEHLHPNVINLVPPGKYPIIDGGSVSLSDSDIVKGDGTNRNSSTGTEREGSAAQESSDEKSPPGQSIFASEDSFRTLANSIPQMAWVTDEEGNIVWYNQRWYDYTGTTLEEMKGWGWQKVHHPKHVDRVVKLIKHSFQTGEIWEDTFPLRSKDGKYRWFLSRAEPIRNSSGEIIRWFGTNTDITEKRKQESELNRSLERLKLAKDSARLGLFEFNLSDNHLEWEPLLKEIWGFEPDEEVNLDKFYERLHPADIEPTEAAIASSTDPDGSGRYEATYRVINRVTEKIYWIRASGVVVFKERKPEIMIGLVNDITDQKKLEESLQSALCELEDADAKKDEFLSVLGHELRNPLAALKASMEILQPKLQDGSELLSIMDHSIGTMSRLLDDLLDLNRIARNRVTLKIDTVDVREVLSEVVKLTRNVCEQKGHTLTFSSEDSLMVKGDPVRLEQIFMNMVFNAYKYTPEGGRIHVSAKRSGDEIRVSVKDNGLGLPEHLQGKIFDPFFQIKKEGHASQGLGIGLALAKKLVEMHKGRIEAESEGENKGSTFSVTLPAKAKTQNAGDAGSHSKTDEIVPGLRVLFIEDDPDNSILMPLVLKSLKCEVEVAVNGIEGLEKLGAYKPNVVISDIGLPDITGHELARRIREAGYKGLMIALSGYSHAEVREKSKAAGFDFHLSKPTNKEELAKVLSSVSEESVSPE